MTGTLDLARWQFAVTTVYHFLFVPLTIGTSLLVAGLQTAWVRTGKERYLRATKFWGKLLLINFAMGVVTGIVQEFQFGMNWSTYSRYVGDIFGAPLAIEALLAFFLESTFLGLWIFGWDKLPKKVHLATIWLASIATMLSAYMILAANSWMQNPVGAEFNEATGRAELQDFPAVFFSSTTLGAFFHTITAVFVTSGILFVAVSAWHLVRRPNHEATTEVFKPSLRLGLVTVLIASIGVVISGDVQARIMTSQQPMKMAAAEALYQTTDSASFSLFTIGSLDGSQELFSLRVPGVLSFMSTGSFSGEVEGINNVQAQSEQRYGPGDYTPNIPIAYWAFRLMIGLGFVTALISIIGLWLTRKKAEGRQLPHWFFTLSLIGFFLPLAANTAGWIFTEMARQPWIVYGMLRTENAVSPAVGPISLIISLVVYVLIYGGLAVVEGKLLIRYAQAGPPPPAVEAGPGDEAEKPLAFAY